MSLIATLHEWQSLAGALIGAATALAVALLIAHLTARRDDVSAAMVVVSMFVSVRAADENLRAVAQKVDISELDYGLWLASKLSRIRPRLSPLFDGSAARVMRLNAFLGAHVDLFRTHYLGVEDLLARLKPDLDRIDGNQAAARDGREVMADAELLRAAFAQSVKYASCGELLITQLVLPNWPVRAWHAIRKRISPSAEEERCVRLLEDPSTK
jgi:hypothetical protein